MLSEELNKKIEATEKLSESLEDRLIEVLECFERFQVHRIAERELLLKKHLTETSDHDIRVSWCVGYVSFMSQSREIEVKSTRLMNYLVTINDLLDKLEYKRKHESKLSDAIYMVKDLK